MSSDVGWHIRKPFLRVSTYLYYPGRLGGGGGGFLRKAVPNISARHQRTLIPIHFDERCVFGSSVDALRTQWQRTDQVWGTEASCSIWHKLRRWTSGHFFLFFLTGGFIKSWNGGRIPWPRYNTCSSIWTCWNLCDNPTVCEWGSLYVDVWAQFAEKPSRWFFYFILNTVVLMCVRAPRAVSK